MWVCGGGGSVWEWERRVEESSERKENEKEGMFAGCLFQRENFCIFGGLWVIWAA